MLRHAISRTACSRKVLRLQFLWRGRRLAEQLVHSCQLALNGESVNIQLLAASLDGLALSVEQRLKLLKLRHFELHLLELCFNNLLHQALALAFFE